MSSHRDRLARGPSGSAAGSLQRIWSRLSRPIDPIGATETLLGMRHRSTRQFVGALTAGSIEARDLIDGMPHLLRSLSISTLTVPERVVGSVHGPVLWSETMAARASSAGDPGVFVCSTAMRAYDTDENRVLVSALDAIRFGGREVDFLHRPGAANPPIFAVARKNGAAAARYLEHRALSGVPIVRRRGRTAGRIRITGRRKAYAPAVAMYQRAAEPLEVEDLRSLADGRTTAQHDLLVALVDAASARGVSIGDFYLDHHTLHAGPLSFRHLEHATPERPGGVMVGSLLVDVPDMAGLSVDASQELLAARAGGRRAMVVAGRSGVRTAIDMAISDGLLAH